MRKLLERRLCGKHVILASYSEHIAAQPVCKIAVRKARARENTLEVAFQLGIVLALKSILAGGDCRRNIFRALHSALNLKGFHADFL